MTTAAYGLYFQADVEHDPTDTAFPGYPGDLGSLATAFVSGTMTAFLKFGPGNHDWVAIGTGGGGSANQVFRYVISGPDQNPTVTLPVPRADANYNVQLTQGAATSQYALEADTTTFTTTDFALILGAEPIEGDIIMVTVETRTD